MPAPRPPTRPAHEPRPRAPPRSLGELGAALQYNGLDASALFDNSTYAVLVLDEASRTAIGAPLESFPISQYGDGLISNDTAGTESELVSDLVYVCTVENTTVAFDHGYEVGYRPAAGVGVILIQALPDGSMLWTIDTTSAHAAARLPHAASRPAARCSPRAATAASPARR